MRPAAINDYRNAARRRLPRFLFEYIDGGADAEITLKRNLADLESVVLRQRVLRNVDNVDLSVRLFGDSLSMPVALGPIGLAGMNARRGETQAARAAHAAGIPFCLSTVSTCPIKEVAAAVPRPIWFQLYVLRDRGFMGDLLDRAEAAGCRTLVFTVDLPMPGTRYRDLRSGLTGAAGFRGAVRRTTQALLRPRWAWDVGICGKPHTLGNVEPLLGPNTGLEDFLGWIKSNFDPTVTWRDVEWVRKRWRGPLIIKGILDVADARSAADFGADGVVVSNHGGRQLDGAASSARMLPEIAAAVGDRLTVLADGGVRSGVDVVRMLALGARGVLLGRAWAYALGARGEAGVAHVLQLIDSEMRVALALTGCTRIADVTAELVVH